MTDPTTTPKPKGRPRRVTEPAQDPATATPTATQPTDNTAEAVALLLDALGEDPTNFKGVDIRKGVIRIARSDNSMRSRSFDKSIFEPPTPQEGE